LTRWAFIAHLEVTDLQYCSLQPLTRSFKNAKLMQLYSYMIDFSRLVSISAKSL